MRCYGIDFTSRPSRRKPICVATGVLGANLFKLEDFLHFQDFDGYERWLSRPGPWIAGFDFPFSLSRQLIEAHGWPTVWPELIAFLRQKTRPELQSIFKAWCDARPAGSKFAHRQTDYPAGSSPSMKWVNPPVAWMLLEGAPRLIDAGVTVPGMVEGDPDRIALEAYPGYTARRITRISYKSEEKLKQTQARRDARELILSALERGEIVGIPALLSAAQRKDVLDDPMADRLDALMCALQAAWAWQRRVDAFGLPPGFDRLEGWTVSVPAELALSPMRSG